ncbi:MAG: hypothetical protein WDO13_05075 [Verrucomicrobiota bacterium]
MDRHLAAGRESRSPSFQCLASLLASLGLWRLLRDEKSGWILSLAVSVCVAIFLGSVGLRPDALGLALFAWGALPFEAGSRSGWALCSLSLFLSAITCPNFIPLIPFVVGGAIYRDIDRGALFRQEGLMHLLALAGAASDRDSAVFRFDRFPLR